MLQQVKEWYASICNSGEPLVKDWPLVKSPIPIFIIAFSYILLVIYGPALMKKRSSFDLKNFMFFYNFSIVCISAHIAHGSIKAISSYPGFTAMFYQKPHDLSDGSSFDMIWFHYLYFLTKILEFTDTIIFILRKKFNQVSLFHVYHHISIFLVMWHQFKYNPGPFGMPLSVINCIVHVFMYSYYLLSGLGPGVQKFLWWKKYITQMQLIQLCAIMFYLTYVFFHGTYYPTHLVIIYFCYNVTMIGFFIHFYLTSYRKLSKIE
ncbi:hypothetical protein MXB_3829 [Myxobolus squamalis]|nr:hypothetical protein MXB_3829 [Myxobolus squamalis]